MISNLKESEARQRYLSALCRHVANVVAGLIKTTAPNKYRVGDVC